MFERFGFDINAEGNEVSVTAVPFLIKGPLPPGFFTDLLDKMNEAGFDGDSAYAHRENAVAAMACKAAVKANDILTGEEAEGLIRRMLALENPFTCPHGRPTVINITKKEMERKFKRT
jgi:DNA mismatch repair protein MutL